MGARIWNIQIMNPFHYQMFKSYENDRFGNEIDVENVVKWLAMIAMVGNGWQWLAMDSNSWQ